MRRRFGAAFRRMNSFLLPQGPSEDPPVVWIGLRLEGTLEKPHVLPRELVYSGTDKSKLVDFIVSEYVPELLRTGTVPAPTVEQREYATRRQAREAHKARTKLIPEQAAATATSKRC